MIVAFCAVVAMTSVAAACLCVADPQNWGSWMLNFKFSGKRAPSSGNTGSARVADPAELQYFGEGRAELGDFSIRMFDPITRTVLRSDFQLEGETVFGNRRSFQEFMKSNHRFFREQVMVTIRSCDPEELADDDLTLVEKKLVSRVNRALGRHLLNSVKMHEYKLYESAESVFIPVEGEGGATDTASVSGG